jgi:hypothetical protein
MGPEDLAEAAGRDSVYETAEKLRRRLDAEIEDFVREADPAAPPDRAAGAEGRRTGGR